jgi:2-polyprenyl-3-methyl-5-hydroxy-6-metoxy-1,4-benzoquinol methylase
MSNIPGNEKIAIGLPRGADTGFKYEFIESLFRMFGHSPCNYKMISASKVHHIARNEIMQNFLETDMNYLLFIDSDMIWEPESLEQAYNLIQHPKVDIVTGIYFQKGKPHLPVIKKLDLEAGCYNIFIEWGNEPFEVDGAGMGFMLIPKYVVEKMKQPLCTWDGGFSEDLNFCLKAKKDHGFKIWAHPQIKLGHIGNRIITGMDWLHQYKPAMKSYIREAMVGTKNWLKKTYPNWREDLGIHPLDFKNVNTKEYWDNIYEREGGADTNWRRYLESFDFVINHLLADIQPDARVLELGCGVGVFAKMLKVKYPSISYQGIDISKVAIDELKKAGFEGIVEKVPPIICSLPVDLIIGLEFLEHLDDKPRLETIKEVSEMIKDKGKAIFTVPDDCMPPEQVIEHRVKYTKDSFEKFLMKAFKDVKVHRTESRHTNLTEVKTKYLTAVCSNRQKRYFKNTRKEGKNGKKNNSVQE